MNFKNILKAGFILNILVSATAYADHNHHNHLAYSGTPASVSATHLHAKGEWMASYKYMEMHMSDIMSDDSEIQPGSTDFMVEARDMQASMHMFGLMYGVSDNHTVMVMVPEVRKKMRMINNNNGAEILMSSQGVGDVKITNIIGLRDDLLLNLGISLPTGSIKETNAAGTRLPYGMQLGSGTYDILAGLSDIKTFGNKIFGLKVDAIFRLGRNSQDYSLGEQYKIASWFGVAHDDYNVSTIGFNARHQTRIDGIDDQIEATGAFPRVANSSGGTEFSIALGHNHEFSKGWLEDTKFSVEYDVPVYQYVNGTQLARDYTAFFKLSKVF